MNKKVLFFVAAALLIAVITGVIVKISIGRGTDDEGEKFLPAVKQIDVKNLEDAKLTIYIEGERSDALTEVLDALNSKLRDELKTELSFEFVWEYPENYLNAVRKAVSSGSPCDAFYFSSYFPIMLKELAEEGLAKDITDLFPQYAPGYFSKFSGDDIDAIDVNGKIYAIPSRIPNTSRKCVIVRSDIMERYKIPEIKNYSDYEAYLEAVRSNEPNHIPMIYWDTTLGLFSEVNGYATVDYEMGLVYKRDSPLIKLEAWEQTDGFADCLNRVKSWQDKGYLTKNVGIASIDEQIIKSGKWASFIGRWGNQFDYNAILTANGIQDYKYEAYQLHEGISERNSPLENGLLVNEKSALTDRVLMFIEWLQSKQENYDMLMYGVKGTHYIEGKDYITPPEGVKMENSFFSWGWKAPFRNMDYERVNYPGLKEQIKNYNDVINDKTKYPPHMGFYPNYSEIEGVTSRRMAFAELDRKIYTGSFEDSDIEEYIKEQKENGIDNIVLQVQQQLDEYLKEK